MKPDEFERLLNTVMTSAPPSPAFYEQVLSVPARAIVPTKKPLWAWLSFPKLASGAVMASLLMGLWLGGSLASQTAITEDELDLVAILSEDEGSLL